MLMLVHTLQSLLFIIVIPSVGKINDEIRDQMENVTFVCEAVGEPVSDISWYFNDVMINVSDNSSSGILTVTSEFLYLYTVLWVLSATVLSDMKSLQSLIHEAIFILCSCHSILDSFTSVT